MLLRLPRARMRHVHSPLAPACIELSAPRVHRAGRPRWAQCALPVLCKRGRRAAMLQDTPTDRHCASGCLCPATNPRGALSYAAHVVTCACMRTCCCPPWWCEQARYACMHMFMHISAAPPARVPGCPRHANARPDARMDTRAQVLVVALGCNACLMRLHRRAQRTMEADNRQMAARSTCMHMHSLTALTTACIHCCTRSLAARPPHGLPCAHCPYYCMHSLLHALTTCGPTTRAPLRS